MISGEISKLASSDIEALANMAYLEFGFLQGRSMFVLGVPKFRVLVVIVLFAGRNRIYEVGSNKGLGIV